VNDGIFGITVRLVSDINVAFLEEEASLPLFTRPRAFFPSETLKAIAFGGVTATVGPSDSRDSRVLRLQGRSGEIFFEETIVLDI
jgi:hypothetical protein